MDYCSIKNYSNIYNTSIGYKFRSRLLKVFIYKIIYTRCSAILTFVIITSISIHYVTDQTKVISNAVFSLMTDNIIFISSLRFFK